VARTQPPSKREAAGIHLERSVTWIVVYLVAGLVCASWYLAVTLSRAYDEIAWRKQLAAAILSGLIAFAAIAKLIHEADQALSSFPLAGGGLGGLLIVSVIVLLLVASEGSRR